MLNHNFLTCARAEIKDLTVCIVVKGEKFLDLDLYNTQCQTRPSYFHILHYVVDFKWTEPLFSYAIYLCFGIPSYFIGAYHKLIFLLAKNGILSPD